MREFILSTAILSTNFLGNEMNNKTNYAAVGLFVITGFIAMILFIYWLVRPTDEMEMKKYVIYFNESVLGLNLDAPVKYRGITVGKVVKLGINPKNSEQVRVVISVNKDTPIKTSTVAKLTAQGITGLSYINLSLGDKNSPLLTKVPPGEKYPVIKSVPSFFESFQTSFGHIYNKVAHTLDQIEVLLSEENQKELHGVLHESRLFMSKLNKVMNEKTIRHMQNTMQNIDSITAQADKAMPDVHNLVRNSVAWERGTLKAFEKITQSYIKIQKTSDKIGEAVARGDFNLRAMTSEFIPALNKSLNTLNGVLSELRVTIKEYKESPRDILFKEVQEKKGPGEK